MPRGRKTGGRQAGTPNAVTASLREQVEQAAGGKPLPVLLAEVGRKAQEKGDYQLAVTAYAKAAAFVYPRLQAVTVNDANPVHYPPLLVDANGMAKVPDNYPGIAIRFHIPPADDQPSEGDNDPNTHVVSFKG
jgi:hypothetical protein